MKLAGNSNVKINLDDFKDRVMAKKIPLKSENLNLSDVNKKHKNINNNNNNNNVGSNDVSTSSLSFDFSDHSSANDTTKRATKLGKLLIDSSCDFTNSEDFTPLTMFLSARSVINKQQQQQYLHQTVNDPFKPSKSRSSTKTPVDLLSSRLSFKKFETKNFNSTINGTSLLEQHNNDFSPQAADKSKANDLFDLPDIYNNNNNGGLLFRSESRALKQLHITENSIKKIRQKLKIDEKTNPGGPFQAHLSVGHASRNSQIFKKATLSSSFTNGKSTKLNNLDLLLKASQIQGGDSLAGSVKSGSSSSTCSRKFPTISRENGSQPQAKTSGADNEALYLYPCSSENVNTYAYAPIRIIISNRNAYSCAGGLPNLAANRATLVPPCTPTVVPNGVGSSDANIFDHHDNCGECYLCSRKVLF